MSYLRWALLRVVAPRLCLIGFNYAQTFFIERAVTLLHEPMNPDSKNDGYGLIGAAALVYGGIAVCTIDSFADSLLMVPDIDRTLSTSTFPYDHYVSRCFCGPDL